jgi:hypothetical protein
MMNESHTAIGKDSKVTLAVAITFFSLFIGAWRWLDMRFEDSRTDIASRFTTVASAQSDILLRLERMEVRANDARDEIKEIRSALGQDVSEIEFENWELRAEKVMQVLHQGLELPPLHGGSR